MGRRHRLGLINRPVIRATRNAQQGAVVAAVDNTDPYWANVVLLALNENGADGSTTFADQSAKAHTITVVGNTQYDTAQAPTGMTSSGLFDGTGDVLTLDGDADFAFGTGDFTIEFMARWNSSTVLQILYDSRPATTQGAYPTIYMNSDDTLRYFHNSADRITGAAISDATWYHIALCRSGTSTKLFLDGTQTGSTYTDSTTYVNGASRPMIAGHGFFGSGSSNFNGHLACLRVTTAARYTANFTPPTLPMPTS